MAKSNKDIIQKIIAAVLLIIVVIVGFYTTLMSPLQAKIAKNKADIEELREKIATADRQLQKIQNIEKDVTAAEEQLDLIHELMPTASPIAWFPPKMIQFFERQNIEDVSVNMSSTSSLDKESLKDYRDISWSIKIPEASFIPLGYAIAGLENEQPMLEITSLRIEADDQELKTQSVEMITTLTLRK